MKKFLCMLLATSMVIGMTVSAAASQTITFTDDGTGVVTTNDSSTSAITITDQNTSTTNNQTTTVQETEKKEEDDSKTSAFDSILSSIFGKSDDSSTNGNTSKKMGYIALGQDLTAEQRATVLSLLGVSEADLVNYEIVYTTNQEEHNWLDKYISPGLIGTRSLSSVLVKPAESGHGVVVTTSNINYCTMNMYRNALITAGVTDADIKVVAPTPISGTAALIGALKAYEKMSGEPVSSKALDTSLNELVTTTEISQAVGSDAQAEELISYIKTVVATNDLNTREEIEAAIRKGMVDLNVTLSEDEIKQTVDLMMKIKAMGIDYAVLVEQADDIYAKYKDDINNGTFDLSKVDLNDAGLRSILQNALSNSFKNIGNGIKSFLAGLFSK